MLFVSLSCLHLLFLVIQLFLPLFFFSMFKIVLTLNVTLMTFITTGLCTCVTNIVNDLLMSCYIDLSVSNVVMISYCFTLQKARIAVLVFNFSVFMFLLSFLFFFRYVVSFSEAPVHVPHQNAAMPTQQTTL